MALEDMLKALEEEGRAECERILSQAKARADQIIKEAEQEGTSIKQAHMVKAEALLKSERSKILNEASFTVKKAVIQAKDSLISKVFDRISERVQKIRESSEYREVFRKLASEALANTQGKIVISVDKRDEDIAKSILKDLGADYELRTDLECGGGLAVTTVDGRITFVNTLDSRLDKARAVLKPDVASILFG